MSGIPNRWAFTVGLWLWLTSMAIAVDPSTYTVCTWNIQNFGVTDRFIDNRRVPAAMKPEVEIESMLAILKRIQPDILGVSEILQAPDDQYLKELQRRFTQAGLDLRHQATVQGEDPRIQCALFSRYPIVEQYPHDDLRFKVSLHSKSTGQKTADTMRISRGLLHARIKVREGYEVEVMQVHLKSRRPYPEIVSDEPKEEGDAYVRRQEALLIKNTMNRHLKKNPKANLILMGDLNDLPRSKPVKTLIGPKDATVRMYDLWLKDWLGDWWTHYYVPDNQYERIDYMIVSHGLIQDWDSSKSFIYRQREKDGAEYNTYTPSDHRPLVAVFRCRDESQPKSP